MFKFTKILISTAVFALIFSCNDNTITTPSVGIYLTPSSLNVTTGDTAQIFAQITQNPNGTPIEWSSSNEEVVEIDSQGNIIATGGGSATITATIAKTSASCAVEVTPATFISGWVNTPNGSLGKVWIGTKEYMSAGDSTSNTYFNDIDFVNGAVICVGTTELEMRKSGGAAWSTDGMLVDFGPGFSINAVSGRKISGSDIVYYAGTTEVESPYIATIWSTNMQTILKGSNGNSFGNDIAFQDNKTTIVVGSAIDAMNITQPALWTDEEITFLSSSELGGEAYHVATSSDNTYVTGHVGNAAILWTNGVADTLLSNGNRATTDGICIDNGNVFVAGYITNDDGVQVPVYWQDGSINMLDNSEAGVAKDIVVIGDDIYVTGITYSGMYQIATLWKNGEPTQLAPDGTTSGVSAIIAH